MSATARPVSRPEDYAELHSGDRMTREEFHEIYSQMPEDFKAELIGGIVYVASPLRHPHGNSHLKLGTLMGLHEMSTPGVDAADNATVILADNAEPQPDVYLRILSENGGQSKLNSKEYIVGAPELVAEIAYSHTVDLGAKRDDYLRNDGARLLATLQRGLASPEHADFVTRLAAARQ